ncbi:CbiX/SirB N-terminal domain-containing protein [Halostella pelagica]|uniref:CbiX/SirB N-terminal domain-containing protein n=1 Tax=Halostella pelagica TaxID=2583824 RepID=UPI0010803CB2|nr:CbiX/SirB N-terminal domain-containing protein [Halostella pelagica]
MTDALLLIARDTTQARDVVGTHARRLRESDIADSVRTAYYEHDTVHELADEFTDIEAETVYALPVTIAHTYETTDDIPAALSYCPGEVHYCEPIGRSPGVTGAICDRAATRSPRADSLVLVGLGNSALPYGRQTVEHHASRLRDRGTYDEVETCYLLQNPAVECVRYNVTGDDAVAVPLFLTGGRATEEEIPRKLELDRGGIAYADVLGTHEGVTDAMRAAVDTQRVMAGGSHPSSFEATLAMNARPMATDGRGD